MRALLITILIFGNILLGFSQEYKLSKKEIQKEVKKIEKDYTKYNSITKINLEKTEDSLNIEESIQSYYNDGNLLKGTLSYKIFDINFSKTILLQQMYFNNKSMIYYKLYEFMDSNVFEIYMIDYKYPMFFQNDKRINPDIEVQKEIFKHIKMDVANLQNINQ